MPNEPFQPTAESRAIARADAVLPTVAYDAAPTELTCSGYDTAVFFITYTPDAGAATMAMRWIIEVSPYAVDQAVTEDWFLLSHEDAGDHTGAGDHWYDVETNSWVLTPADTNAVSFMQGPIELNGAIERIRIRCIEEGDAANPGNAQVLLGLGMI